VLGKRPNPERRKKIMTVKVESLDGSINTHLFDPDNRDSVIEFYIAKLIAKEILSYEVID
jgi:hypothetical protein